MVVVSEIEVFMCKKGKVRMSSGMRVMMGIFLWFPSSKASSKLIHAPCCLIIALLSSEFSILSPDPPLKQWGDEGPRPARVDTPDPKLHFGLGVPVPALFSSN